MSLRKNIGCTDCNDVDTIIEALQQPTPIPAGTVAHRVLKIGAAEPSLSNDAAGVLIAGGLLAGALMYKNKVIGKKKKRSVLPLVIIGGGALAYYLYTKSGANDPELQGLVVVPGVEKLSDTMRDAVFVRAATWVNPISTNAWYPEIYRDVLIHVLPQYAEKFRAMNNDESTKVYQLVIDHPAGLIQSQEPALYNDLQAIKTKFNLKFY